MINKNEIIRIVKFGMTGVLNTLVDFVVSALFFNLIGLPEVIANLFGFCCGMLCSYTINRTWTFKSKSGFFSPEMIKFIVVNLIGLLINLGLMSLSVNVIFANSAINENIVFYGSKIVITCVVMIVNFIGNRLWVFKQSSDK